jgi:hypothetical protein
VNSDGADGWVVEDVWCSVSSAGRGSVVVGRARMARGRKGSR